MVARWWLSLSISAQGANVVEGIGEGATFWIKGERVGDIALPTAC